MKHITRFLLSFASTMTILAIFGVSGPSVVAAFLWSLIVLPLLAGDSHDK